MSIVTKESNPELWNALFEEETNNDFAKSLQIELLENKRKVKEVKNDLLYVLEQLDGYLDKGWTIDLNFTDIREKYKEDIKEYENWE